MDGDPSELELAIETVVKNYDKYAKRTLAFWKKRRIRKKNFQEMLTQELSHMLTSTNCEAAVDKMFKDLDEDRDGSLSFNEYWDLIGHIAHTLAQVGHQQKDSVE